MRNDDIGPGCVTPSALALIPSLCVSGFVAVFTYGLVSDWWRWTAGSFFVVFGSTYAMLMAQYRSLWLAQNWPGEVEQEQTVETPPLPRINHWQERERADLRQEAIYLVDESIGMFEASSTQLLSADAMALKGWSDRHWKAVTDPMAEVGLIVKVERQPTRLTPLARDLRHLRELLTDPLSPTG